MDAGFDNVTLLIAGRAESEARAAPPVSAAAA
jgi:hypothetical protein